MHIQQDEMAFFCQLYLKLVGDAGFLRLLQLGKHDGLPAAGLLAAVGEDGGVGVVHYAVILSIHTLHSFVLCAINI